LKLICQLSHPKERIKIEMMKKIIIIIIGLIIIVSIAAGETLQPWENKTYHPNQMQWNYLTTSKESNTKCFYSKKEYKKHKNGNVCIWVGLETNTIFDAVYTCIDLKRKKFKQQKEYIFDKQSRVTAYTYDIMRLMPPDKYFVTDCGGEWDRIQSGTVLDVLLKRLSNL